MSSAFNFSGRRSFIKKSLAMTVAASQPVFLAGLIRADGGGGGTTGPETTVKNVSTVTTDHYTSFPDTTEFTGTTEPFTETTNPETGGYYYF